MSTLKTIVHPVKKEFRKEKCGFDHAPADDFVKSQWQSRTKSIAYLIYRWLVALFFTAVVIESMLSNEPTETNTNFWLYFIYMTNWGILMCMLTNLLGAILVTTWHYHPEYADKLLNLGSLTSPFRVYWGMHIITLVLSIVITIIYWSILYDASESSLNATNLLTHAFNSVCMFIDLLIVAHPLRLLHIFLPVLFGITYAIFSFIYQQLGGLNKKGKPYIYHVIDWREPPNALITVFGVLLLTCCTYMALFTIYKLRTLLYRKINNASFCLPTTAVPQSKAQNKNNNKNKNKNKNKSATTIGNGIQHSSSTISMVFPGYNNNGFTTSNETITK